MLGAAPRGVMLGAAPWSLVTVLIWSLVTVIIYLSSLQTFKAVKHSTQPCRGTLDPVSI